MGTIEDSRNAPAPAVFRDAPLPTPPEDTDGTRAAEAAYRGLSTWVLATAEAAGLEEIEQQEVLQRVGLVLVEKREAHDASKGSWCAWAVGITQNVVLEVRRGLRTARRRRDLIVSVSDLPDLSPTPEQRLRAREALAILRAAVRAEHREVFELSALGCTAAEIGEKLALPRSTVEWQLKQARKDLARALARHREDRSDLLRVRAVPCPFATVDELSRALRGDPAGDAAPVAGGAGDAVPVAGGARDAAPIARGAGDAAGTRAGAPPSAPAVRPSPRRGLVLLGWSGALSRGAFVTLAPLVLLSVHLVTVIPMDLRDGRAVVPERPLVQRTAASTADVREGAREDVPPQENVGVPAVAPTITADEAAPPPAVKPLDAAAAARPSSLPGTAAARPSSLSGAQPAHAPVPGAERAGQIPTRRARPREWLVLRVITQQEVARQEAARQEAARQEAARQEAARRAEGGR